MDRPEINIPLTKTDKVFDVLIYLLVALLWAMTIYGYYNAPETVPVHFGLNGEPDGYGQKRMMFLPAILCTFISFILAYINTMPHMMNLGNITPENAPAKYAVGAKVMRMIRLVFVLVFLLLEYYSFKVANGTDSKLSTWFLILVISLFVVPLTYYFIKINRIK